MALSYFLMWGGQQAALGEWSWVLSRVPQTLGWLVLLVALGLQRSEPEGSAGEAEAAVRRAGSEAAPA